MKNSGNKPSRLRSGASLCRVSTRGTLAALILHFAFCIFPLPAPAFPPAPYHRIYGLVRDEYGTPLTVTGAQIVFETSGGVQVSGQIIPGLEPGINYQLDLPMDAGTAADLYKATALKPLVQFRIRVKIGTTTYLPIEMVANYANLGKPAARTRIDLTIGEDLDGDGLPDAWQRLLRTLLGPGAKIGPNEDADGDGISNLNEYLAGTYAFDPTSGFRLNLMPGPGGTRLLEFVVINPRTYTVFSSTDLITWTPVQFTVPADGPSALSRPNFTATDIHTLQVAPILPSGTNVKYFFKVQMQ